ncbi:MAG: PilZ domain-containing protein [Myxococcales bacterium]
MPSRDLSVSGAFLESSYYLKVGTRLEVCFQLEEEMPPLTAVAEIVRHEGESKDGPGGFALRFVELKGDARVAITELMLGESLSEFAQRYLKSKRAKAFSSEAERIVDLLASWEVFKATGR